MFEAKTFFVTESVFYANKNPGLSLLLMSRKKYVPQRGLYIVDTGLFMF